MRSSVRRAPRPAKVRASAVSDPTAANALAIAAGAGLPAVIDSVDLGTTAETEEIPLSSEEIQELGLLMRDASINLTNIGFGEVINDRLKRASNFK